MDTPPRRRVLAWTAAALTAVIGGCASPDAPGDPTATTGQTTTAGDATTTETTAEPTTTEPVETTTEETATETEAPTEDETTTEETTTEETATEETTTTTEETTTEETTTEETTTASEPTEVTVGPGGSLLFDPASVTIETGETVEWTWSSDGHNIVVDKQPEGADWEGTEGGGATTYPTGHTHTHTFEVAGTYEYFCQPHASAGMTGEVVVE